MTTMDINSTSASAEPNEPKAPTASPGACWLCGATGLQLLRASTMHGPAQPDSMRISDASYGSVGAIYRCDACGFLQCPEVGDVLSLYEQMDDPGYVESEDQRRLQAARLVRSIAEQKDGGTLLDIGAGSGLLVEEAEKVGFKATGIEPCEWLQKHAQQRGTNVLLGTLPHPAVSGTFDVVTAVDVIEHVDDPVGMLRAMRAQMRDDGIGVVVTPDVASLAARLTGAGWWHFRVAHICYFTRDTLMKALSTAGLEPISISRPWWYFSGDYLWSRLMVYAPKSLKLRAPRWTSRLTIPLNLFDSYMVVFRKAR